MTSRRPHIEEILEHAVHLSEPEQSGYLQEACAGDENLLEAIKSHLETDTDELLEHLLTHGLSGILKSAAREQIRQIEREKEQLQREEEEERRIWKGRHINGQFFVRELRRLGPIALLLDGEDTHLDDAKVIIKMPRRWAYIENDLDDERTRDEKANTRNAFRKEFDALFKLRGHANIVRVLAKGEEFDGRPFIVQEFIEGRNASELLDENKDAGLDIDKVADIIRQAGTGLEAAHHEEIIHLDVKAENIMVNSYGQVKLIDFNAAAVKLPISPRSTVLNDEIWGTLGYASPEQIKNMGEPDKNRKEIELTAASDVYSLAVTAYHLLCGKLPFSMNFSELIIQQNSCSFEAASEIRSDIPRQVDSVLKAALNPDPNKRTQSAKQFAESFALALESVPGDFEDTAGDSTGPTPPSPSPLRPKGNIALIALVVCIIAGLAFVLWWFSSRRTVGLGPTASETPIAIPSPSAVPTKSGERSFSYWLDLTRTVNGKPSGGVIKASGKEVFIYGDTVLMNFVSSQSGYLYLVNEGRNYQDATTFYFEGKFRVKSNERLASTRLAFDNKTGVEKFWVLFSNSPVPLFEQYNSPREIPLEKTEEARGLLNQYAIDESSAKEDISNAETKVTASGDTIAYRLDLRHRAAD